MEEGPEKTKPCQMCGKRIGYVKGNKKYCPECAQIAAVESRRRRQQEKKAQQPAKRCKLCGGPIAEGKRDFCDYCRTLTQEERTRRTDRKQPTTQPDNRSLLVLARLAREYQSPYNSYGKLKSYIDSTGHLPNEQYLRKHGVSR